MSYELCNRSQSSVFLLVIPDEVYPTEGSFCPELLPLHFVQGFGSLVQEWHRGEARTTIPAVVSPIHRHCEEHRDEAIWVVGREGHGLFIILSQRQVVD